jgi:hypothetical protein
MSHEPWDLIITNKRAPKNATAVDSFGCSPHALALPAFPPSIRLVVLVLLSCPNAFAIPPRRSLGQRTPVVHYLSDQPSDERLSTHRGLSAGNLRRGALRTAYFPSSSFDIRHTDWNIYRAQTRNC